CVPSAVTVQTYPAALLCPRQCSPIPHPTLSAVLLMLGPPPPSTLFPYTTLFRSRGKAGAAHTRSRPCCPGCSTRTGSWWRSRGRDRKSTRLNSSHVKISYAVFCLKKKKKPPPLAVVKPRPGETPAPQPIAADDGE